MNLLTPLFFRPFTALVLFSVLFLIYHLPPLLTYFSQHLMLHNAFITLLFLLSLQMWQPIATCRFTMWQKKRFAHWSGILLLPACLMFILFAFMDALNNPFHTQMTTHLCLPPQSSYTILPSPFNTKIDQISSGLFMLGLHKLSIRLTLRLGKISVR